MTEPTRDPLDATIDRVAARLVTVQDDGDATERIVAALPPRKRRGSWVVHALMPQVVAVAGLVLVAVYVRSTVNPVGSSVETPVGTSVGMPAGTIVETPAEPPLNPVGTLTSKPREKLRGNRRENPREEPSSFELFPIVRPRELTVTAIGATTPIEVESQSIAPIVLSDLALASDAPPLPFKE